MCSDSDRRTIPESSTKLDSLDSTVWVVLQPGCRNDADGECGLKWTRYKAGQMLRITLEMASILCYQDGSSADFEVLSC